MDQQAPDVEKWAMDRSVSNMLHYYRNSLLSLMKNGVIVDSVPQGTRRRLCEHGILRRFGSKFELTELGSELLKVVDASESK